MQHAVFPGDYHSLERISAFVARAAQAAGMDENAVYQVQLAVDEACTNIIEHAYGGEGLGEIECTVQPLEDSVAVILRDRGRPFDPAQVPEPNLDVPLEDLPSRGLGLFWIHKIMDEVRFEFMPGGNQLTLIKRK